MTREVELLELAKALFSDLRFALEKGEFEVRDRGQLELGLKDAAPLLWPKPKTVGLPIFQE